MNSFNSHKSFRVPVMILAIVALSLLLLSACQALEPAQEVQANAPEAAAEEAAAEEAAAEEAAAEEAAAEEAAAEEAAAEEAAAEEAAAGEAAAEEAAAEEAAAEEAAAEEAAAEEAAAEEAAAEEAAAEEAAAEEAAAEEAAAEEEPQLATAMASSKLTNQPGRAIVTARGNHFIVDSVPPIEGPNEELNPLDMILGSLATCGMFIAEHVAQVEAMPLEDVVVGVEADLDASGVAGSGADPRLQKMRVHMDMPGTSAEQAAQIVENFQARCPIYTTLSRATDIEITVGDEEVSAPTEGLNTAKVSAQLSNQPGRAIVSARGNHFVIDSVPPLAGPNEERNPLDLILGSLATCGTFIFESAAQEMDIPLTGVSTLVEGDFDPRGVGSMGSVDPRIQAFRVTIEAEGIDEAQGEQLTEQFQQRCPIYTTLQLAAPIEVTVNTS